MKELKASTKAGQRFIDSAKYIQGYTLSDVYGNYSSAKEKAYNWCLGQFNDTENAHSFRICSHNSFSFTCAWMGEKDGELILRYETSNNSYLVWLER